MRLFYSCLILIPSLLFSKTEKHVVLDSPSYIGGAGFFHNFNIVLGVLDIYDQKEEMSLTIDFQDKGLYYEPSQGKNWWSYFFEILEYPAKSQQKGRKIHKILSDIEKAAFGNGAHFYMERERAFYLIRKYIHVKKEILDEVKEFVSDYFEGHVIGIHYRATDKWYEAEFLDMETLLIDVEKEIERHEKVSLFIATDDQEALNKVRKKFPAVIYKNHQRALNGEPLHYTTDHPYLQGKEALIDALILSHVDTLFRTNSNLSAVSSFFNPYMRVFTLNDLQRPLFEGISQKGNVNSLNRKTAKSF